MYLKVGETVKLKLTASDAKGSPVAIDVNTMGFMQQAPGVHCTLERSTGVVTVLATDPCFQTIVLFGRTIADKGVTHPANASIDIQVGGVVPKGAPALCKATVVK